MQQADCCVDLCQSIIKTFLNYFYLDSLKNILFLGQGDIIHDFIDNFLMISIAYFIAYIVIIKVSKDPKDPKKPKKKTKKKNINEDQNN
jgi:hypothetical protein